MGNFPQRTRRAVLGVERVRRADRLMDAVVDRSFRFHPIAAYLRMHSRADSRGDGVLQSVIPSRIQLR